MIQKPVKHRCQNELRSGSIREMFSKIRQSWSAFSEVIRLRAVSDRFLKTFKVVISQNTSRQMLLFAITGPTR